MLFEGLTPGIEIYNAMLLGFIKEVCFPFSLQISSPLLYLPKFLGEYGKS